MSLLMSNEHQIKAPTSIEKSIEKHVADLITFLTEPHSSGPVYDSILAMVESAMIRIALKRNDNIKSKAALYLGISRNSLQAKMTRLGIDKKGEK